MSSVSSSPQKLKMENLQTTYDYFVWTDDFFIPQMIDLKSIIYDPSAPFFMIQVRVQEFLQFLPEKGDSIIQEPRGPFIVETFCLPNNAVIHDDAADDSILGKYLRHINMPLYKIQPIIRDVSALARTMMSQPANVNCLLLPIFLRIAVNNSDPRDVAIVHHRKFDRRPKIKEEEPMAKRQRSSV